MIRDRLAVADSPGEETFDDDAEALRSIGIDLRAVRDSVASFTKPPRRCSSFPFEKRWRTRTIGPPDRAQRFRRGYPR